MVLDKGVGSSYMDSMCLLVSAVFVACTSRAALIFTLLLFKMITITVNKAAMLMTENVAREMIGAIYLVLSVFVCVG